MFYFINIKKAARFGCPNSTFIEVRGYKYRRVVVCVLYYLLVGRDPEESWHRPPDSVQHKTMCKTKHTNTNRQYNKYNTNKVKIINIKALNKNKNEEI